MEKFLKSMEKEPETMGCDDFSAKVEKIATSILQTDDIEVAHALAKGLLKKEETGSEASKSSTKENLYNEIMKKI